MRARAAFALAAALAAAGALPVRAQDNPALQEAARLAGEGRSADARRIANAEMAKARPGDSAYVEALYWRGRLAASGDSAERDLRRVAIEFPSSRWADDALLQLAQLATAAGNPASALALAQRLRSDYPGSELRAQAALWAGRASFDLGDARGACAMLDSARTEGAADVEFVNRVAFYRGRCASLPPAGAPPAGQPGGAPADSARPGAAPAAPPAAAPSAAAPTPAPAQRPAGQTPGPAARQAAPTERWSVQAAAVRTDAEARRIVSRLERAGLRAHIDRGADRLRRVRVGPYPSEREAQAAVAAVRRAAGGRPFAVREP